MPYSTTKLIRDANLRTQHEQHVNNCQHCLQQRNSKTVYTVINYVAAIALTVLALVIYLEPVSR
jgi:heme/copper-type cytochrome/quinol oxidase subunit 4